MILPIVLLAIFSLAMVGAMVQFNDAVVSDDSTKNDNRALWGVTYVGLWVGVELALSDLIRRDHSLTPSDIGALALAPVGWFTFNAMWLALWGAIEVRNAERQKIPPPPRAVTSRRVGTKLTVAGLGIIALLLVLLGAVSAFFEGVLAIHPALAIIGAMTFIGWTMLIAGAVRLALGVGETTSRDYGRLGKRMAASGEIEVSFRELKDAWRQRLWATDVRWRSAFIMLLGAILGVYGLFGIFIVRGPVVVSVLCAAALIYATARTAAALWRA